MIQTEKIETKQSGQEFFDLTGRRCIVTGAASGIGRAMAERFAHAGAELWLVDLDLESAQKLSGQFNENGGQSHASHLDVGDGKACHDFYQTVKDVWPHGTDVLINNAGIGFKGTIDETDVQDLQRLSRVNVEGVFNLTKAVLPDMVTRRSGSVINTASIGGVLGLRDRVAYCTTKFAVVGMTKSLALDHAADNVRVNCICPGRVHTPFVDQIIQSYDDPEAAYAEMAGTQPLDRMAAPEEIAAAAHYLASDEASFITGTAFDIDGGFSAGK